MKQDSRRFSNSPENLANKVDSVTNNDIPNRQKNNDQKDNLGQKVRPSKKENNDQLRENDESGQGEGGGR